jgi:hypothetical protein
MTWGNFGAASGAQPAAVQPTGVQPFAPGIVGQPAGQGGATLPPVFNSGFESVMAAVSRGEVSLNQIVASGSQFGGNNPAAQAGNPTLMQAISQGMPQNGTNGLNGVGAGGGTVNSSTASSNTAPGSFDNGTSMGGTQTIDAKQTLSSSGVQLVSPIQYGGN